MAEQALHGRGFVDAIGRPPRLVCAVPQAANFLLSRHPDLVCPARGHVTREARRCQNKNAAFPSGPLRPQGTRLIHSRPKRWYPAFIR